MAGRRSRNKGKRGERQFAEMLVKEGWTVHNTADGDTVEDKIAMDTDGNFWSVEIKNTRQINVHQFRQQATAQAKKSKLPWLLACHIDGTSAWLILRQGKKPIIWYT